ncbi:MAG: DsrE/DsrF/DrsH-like family protein [Planctomycetota bacterium]
MNSDAMSRDLAAPNGVSDRSEVPAGLVTQMAAGAKLRECRECRAVGGEGARADADADADAAQTSKASTFVVFSGDLDKHLLAFTLANAAAASGLQTRMFFAFWGVSALRCRRSGRGKSFIERMFGWMVPVGSRALPMSRMNFGGFGGCLIRWRMRRLGMPSLEQHIETAEALGVELVVCEASMQMMGFRLEEMRNSAELGGAAACLEAACDAKVAMVL